MVTAVRTPRINSNDDLVLFRTILSPPGATLRKGDPIAEIETDKAVFTIEAEGEGYVLGFTQPLGELIPVGSVLAWLGSSPDDPMPAITTPEPTASCDSEPTLKATLLLAKFGLSASEIPTNGERLTANDVLQYVTYQERQSTPRSAPRPESRAELPLGQMVALGASGRAMLKYTLWHRDSAVPGYVEIPYDTTAWDEYAIAYQKDHNLLLSPLLPLMTWRLAQLAAQNPLLNSTIVGDGLHQYGAVNVGFTMQTDKKLAMLCVKGAASLSSRTFIDRLTDLMRRGMRDTLTPEETTGVTVSLSSMARWQVARHMPVLPPYTSLIVAHAHGTDGIAALGATYDHRVLTGGEVADELCNLSRPPA